MTQTTQYSIIPFDSTLAKQVSLLVHQSVRTISHPRYKQAQLTAWSTAPRSEKHWQYRLQRSQSWLMVDTNKLFTSNNDSSTKQPLVIGVINVETQFNTRGYIDSLYIAPDYQRQGVGIALYATLEHWVLKQGYRELSVDASYLSKGFFLKQGFTLIQPSYQMTKQQVINSFYLVKPLN
ncbi:GNAT family N-acetyltransferase [Shewanella donghaensis]|uniref:GNAT family N-acetyltransferase n=1 Tax=Shewanella donghaensis TaxID=238836 RepID=UPI001183EFFB|nr:GNAT family N-acetyltransferase [Shewanella donghaensis]